VKRVLLASSAFLRAARRLAKRHPAMADDFQAALELLAEDAHHPALRTHKLKGKLAKSWACSAGYDLRIVFQFVRHGAHEAILLEVVGTHDEVY
jgi:addiction module RelE/StbE family toxin